MLEFLRFQKGSSYYDKNYINKEKGRHYKEVGFLPMWELMKIPDCKILDIGCGVGHLAHYLKDKGFKNYTGIDFSGVAIERAKQEVPEFSFCQMDIFSKEFKELLKNDFDLYICCEVLEHLRGDKKLLQLLKPRPIIFTVPIFHHESHVRFFLTKEDVYKRYEDIVDIKEYAFYKKWHIIKGQIRQKN
ncbi:MAG TPA: class I SAM-dependent methyltransferase [Candidatus Portnoybacteria bacterium]|nr:class I SAM-dependent methyltransferase [Candidatus Portnoybacteria bacterium]